MSVWKKKTVQLFLQEAEESEKGLKKTLTAWSLIGLAIYFFYSRKNSKLNGK